MTYDSPPIHYIPLSSLHPGQHCFASKIVEKKLKNLENKGFRYEKGQPFFYFDDGKSFLPEKKALPVVQTADEYILCDGHHSAMAALFLKALTVPIRILQAYPFKIDEEFWLWAEAQNYVYLLNSKGKKFPPPSQLSELKDDPLRYFVSLTAHRAKSSLHPPIDTTPGVLWVKKGKETPFIEMQIVDRLRFHGFQYEYGEEIFNLEKLIIKAHHILLNDPLPFLTLVPLP